MDPSLKRARSSSPGRDEQQKKKPKTREAEIQVPWFDFCPTENTSLPENIVEMIRFGPHLLSLLDYIRTESSSVQVAVREEQKSLGVEDLPVTRAFHWSPTKEKDKVLFSLLESEGSSMLRVILHAYMEYCSKFFENQGQDAFQWSSSQSWFDPVFRLVPQRSNIEPLSADFPVDKLLIIDNVPATFQAADLAKFVEGHKVENIFLSTPDNASGLLRAVLSFATETDMRSYFSLEDSLIFNSKDGSTILDENCFWLTYPIGAKSQTINIEGTVSSGLDATLFLPSKTPVEFASVARNAPGFIGDIQWANGPIPTAVTTDKGRVLHDLTQMHTLLQAFDKANEYKRESIKLPEEFTQMQTLTEKLAYILATEYSYSYYSGQQFPTYADYLLHIGTQYYKQDCLAEVHVDTQCLSVYKGVNGVFAWKQLQNDNTAQFTNRIDQEYTQRLNTLQNAGKYVQVDENFVLGSKFSSRSKGNVKCQLCDKLLEQKKSLEHLHEKHPNEFTQLKQNVAKTYIIGNYRNIQTAQRNDQCCKKDFELCKCMLGALSISGNIPANSIERTIRRAWKANDKFQSQNSATEKKQTTKQPKIVYTHRYKEDIPKFSIKLW